MRGAAPLVGEAEATAVGGVLAPAKLIRRTAPAAWKSAYHSSPVAGLTSSEGGRVGGGARVLAAQGAALGRGRGQGAPTPPGGSPHGLTGLPSWP